MLFLCTGNSARSILGEALVTQLSLGRIVGYSAGSIPVGKVNLFAREIAESIGYPQHKMRSKSWEEFTKSGSPYMDFIVTVCDRANSETCPVWPGNPTSAHWGFPDPAAVKGSEKNKREAFENVRQGLECCLRSFIDLPLERLSTQQLEAELRKIGEGI